jgi:hypothetical protein
MTLCLIALQALAAGAIGYRFGVGAAACSAFPRPIPTWLPFAVAGPGAGCERGVAGLCWLSIKSPDLSRPSETASCSSQDAAPRPPPLHTTATFPKKIL